MWDIEGSGKWCTLFSISTCNFGSLKNPIQTITILYEVYFRYKWGKWFLWSMVAAQAAKNSGDEWGFS